MAGSISFLKEMGRYFVSWYVTREKKTYKIYKYKGEYMPRALDDKGRDIGQEMARKLLAAMQNDVENGCFRLEKYTKSETDVIPYLRDWVDEIESTISPATYRDYRNSIEKHLVPFFKKFPISLHEIQYDTLVQLMNSITRAGKGKMNVMMCLHRCLKYAKKANRIPAMPEFPEKSMYQIVEPVIQWLPSERQEAVIKAIPIEHQPIFWWLKYHLRRPGEAMALHKEDVKNGVFIVHRGFSDKRYVERTKTGEIHYVPAVSDFVPYIEIEERKQKEHSIISPYFFVNPSSRKKGRHYTLVFLERLWKQACRAAGEDIKLYPGTKHSTASQMINELGYHISELQMAGDWARLESVKKYGKVEVSARKILLEGKKLILGSSRKSSSS